MSKREVFHSDDDARRLPMYPPGLRKNFGSGGVWDGELDHQKFYNNLAATALDLYNLPPVANPADGLKRLERIGQLRSMIEAAEASLLADTFEMCSRNAANLGVQDSLFDDSDDQAQQLSAQYYGVNLADENTVRPSFIAEAAIAMRDSEKHIQDKLFTAEGLRNLCLDTLTALANGEITTKSAREIVKNSQDLDPEDVKQMEHVLLPLAKTATDSAISQRARRMRERLHPKPVEERHKEARERRNVSWWADEDGMATLQVLLPAEDIISIVNTVNYHAVTNVDEDDVRTERQRRADIFRDALIDGWPETQGTPLKARVAVTIPALDMLTDPKKSLADLEGYGPIPIGTALKIAADAPSFIKVLTDPWTGAAIDVAREKYRPSKALKDLLRFRDVHCRFPGCNRLAEQSEIDHIDGWAQGGHTSRTNTELLCKRHQLFKHALGWDVTYRPDGSVFWRTPNGVVCTEVPGSVKTVQNFDFEQTQTPVLPEVQMTDRVRRVLGWYDPPDAKAG
ncbi:DUF222 domain-containing protein [Glutamicibacter sp. NPDC087344]|uniref:HNH endonuclease signature motif containing protein n=1 Tax=Glutamicibacter sp. NPDC087344 TaxID=3363994 RepID=UPI00382F79E8